MPVWIYFCQASLWFVSESWLQPTQSLYIHLLWTEKHRYFYRDHQEFHDRSDRHLSHFFENFLFDSFHPFSPHFLRLKQINSREHLCLQIDRFGEPKCWPVGMIDRWQKCIGKFPRLIDQKCSQVTDSDQSRVFPSLTPLPDYFHV